MTGITWITGAERLAASSAGGDITSTAPPRVVWHTTEAASGVASMWQTMQRVLVSKGAEPQVLYDPLTDRLGQFMPLDVSARALKNDGATRSNRVGRVCIQVEVIAYASKPFTAYWTPGPNYRNLMAALRSWGIPDIWPAGPPPRFIATPPHNEPENPRSRSIWMSKGGHYGHSQIPGNTHGDPGGINVAALFVAGSAPTPTDGFTVSEADRVIEFIKGQDALTGVDGSRWAQQVEENRAQAKSLQAALAKQTAAIEALTKTVAALAAKPTTGRAS